jgi:hypothetical protein
MDLISFANVWVLSTERTQELFPKFLTRDRDVARGHNPRMRNHWKYSRTFSQSLARSGASSSGQLPPSSGGIKGKTGKSSRCCLHMWLFEALVDFVGVFINKPILVS